MLTRNELQEMTKEQAREKAFECLKYENFEVFIFQCFNGVKNELNNIVFYNEIKINDFAYPDYVQNCKTLEEYKKYLLNRCKYRNINIEELNNLKNYADYRKKFDFLNNFYYKILNGISCFNPNYNKLIHKYQYFIWCFKDLETCKKYEKYINILELAFEEKMKNEGFFFEAVKFEMANHESHISWDGFYPALDALNIKYSKLTDKFKYLVNKAYKEICNEMEY